MSLDICLCPCQLYIWVWRATQIYEGTYHTERAQVAGRVAGPQPLMSCYEDTAGELGQLGRLGFCCPPHSAEEPRGTGHGVGVGKGYTACTVTDARTVLQ